MIETLESLSQEKLVSNFENLPFAPEEKLTVTAAITLFKELPLACAPTVSSFVNSELFYERACSSLAVLGCRKQEHGMSFKRMYFEVQAEDLLQQSITLPRGIAENVFTLKLTACSREFPLNKVCCQLTNLNHLDVRYDLAASSHSPLECVPKALTAASNLVSLTLQDSNLTDNDVVTMFEDGGCANDTILDLNLSHNNITSIGLAVIVKTFLAAPESVLCSLELMGNKIDSKGGSILGKSLATNESLLTLNLRLNDLGDLGGSALLDCLWNNATLRHLNLSGNNLASSSANSLVKMLESNDCLSLEAVIITSNPFSEEDEEAIKSCDRCYLDVRGGSSPERQEMFFGKSLMPF